SFIWTWCANPSATPGQNGCPLVYPQASNMQSPFSATTADNGFMVVNSDKLPFGLHNSLLTTAPMDFSDNNEVWINFQTHIGAYNLDPDTRAMLNVSNDNGDTWTSFTCFPNFKVTEGYRWSTNPEQIFIDISEVAANQSTVLIQWAWTGNFEYYWAIDDVKIYDADPRPNSDLRIAREWFAIAPNKIIPASQVAPFGFMADVENKGLGAQSNVKQFVDVFKGNELVYTDTLFLGSIAAGEVVEDAIFENEFLPDADFSDYTAIYQVVSDSTDFTPLDNALSFTFQTSDTTFANEERINFFVAPAATNWAPTELKAWAWGNYFYVPKGSGYQATSVSFSVFNGSVLGGEEVEINLYKWQDFNENDLVESSERERIAFYTHQFTGQEPVNNQSELVNVPLISFDPSGIVALEDNTAYLVMLEHTPVNDIPLIINCNRRHNYEPMIWRSNQVGQPRYASMIAVEGDLANATYEPIGFGENHVPTVRLHIDLLLPTNDPLAPENRIALFPNPVDQQVNIQLDFVDQQSEVQLKIVDVQGRLWQEQRYQNIKKEDLTQSTQQLSPGIYFLQVIADAGMRSQRFVVKR
ncbi:MAG: T9SS type A sorting domain-containing protein, partial [Bacteroidota bacterium]